MLSICNRQQQIDNKLLKQQTERQREEETKCERVCERVCERETANSVPFMSWLWLINVLIRSI